MAYYLLCLSDYLPTTWFHCVQLHCPVAQFCPSIALRKTVRRGGGGTSLCPVLSSSHSDAVPPPPPTPHCPRRWTPPQVFSLSPLHHTAPEVSLATCGTSCSPMGPGPSPRAPGNTATAKRPAVPMMSGSHAPFTPYQHTFPRPHCPEQLMRKVGGESPFPEQLMLYF